MHVGERIAKARAAAGYSQAKLGEAVGAGQTTVSSWERGRTEPTREDVQRVAEALNIDAAVLELANDPQPSRPTVPLVGNVGAGAVAHFYSTADEGLGEVDAPDGSTPKTVAVEIHGESLGPLFEHWLVFYDHVQRPITSDLYGRLCVVGLPNGQVLVKKVKPSRTAGLFHLISNTGEATLTDQEIEWAARVKQMTPR